MPRPSGWQVAVVFLLIGAGAVFLVAPLVLDDDAPPSRVTPSSASSSDRPSEQPPAGTPPAPEFFQTLPKEICETVAKETFLKYVPGGRAEAHGGARAGSCGYGGSAGAPYLRLETRLGEIVDDTDPVGTTKWSFDREYERDSQGDEARTLLLEKVPNLGEEAYRRVLAEQGTEKVTTARVVLRSGNVIITVAYSRPFSGKAEEERDECLDGAEAVAREALRTYTG